MSENPSKEWGSPKGLLSRCSGQADPLLSLRFHEGTLPRADSWPLSMFCYFPSWGGKVITWVVSSGEKELDVQAPSFLSSPSLGCFLLALGFCALSMRSSLWEGSPELSEMRVSGRVSLPSCWVYCSEAFVPHSSVTPSHLACVLISIYQTSASVFSLVPSTDR